MLGFSFLGLGLPSNDHRAEHGDCQGFSRRLYPETVLYSATVDLVACNIYRARLHRARNFNRFNFKTREAQ